MIKTKCKNVLEMPPADRFFVGKFKNGKFMSGVVLNSDTGWVASPYFRQKTRYWNDLKHDLVYWMLIDNDI